MNLLKDGVVHRVSSDMRSLLLSDPHITRLWNDLTPLARNEWICWVMSVKKAATREKHLVRLRDDLLNGKKRPCCWSGCTHRS